MSFMSTNKINIEAVNARAKEEQTPMTKIPSVVEVVEAIRQRHIHLKANNPVGFVHLFADIKKALTADRNQAYTSLVDGIKAQVKDINGESSLFDDFATDIIENVVKPLYRKE